MKCRGCGDTVPSGNKFCSECGAPVRDGSSNVVNMAGDLRGGVYQAGRDVVINRNVFGNSKPGDLDSISCEYEAVPKWRSPFTLALLSWAGVIVGLSSLFPLWKFFQPLINLFNSGFSNFSSDGSQSLWFILFTVLFLALLVVVHCFRIAKHQLRKPLIFGWAISGAGRRITFEKIRAGRCPRCGGKMRYYNKPLRWIDHIEASGRQWREVTERVPALECKRNPKHWTEVDPAEDQEV